MHSAWDLALPERVQIIEVGPRDGFQIQHAFIPTEDKIRIIHALIGAGVFGRRFRNK